MTTNPYFRDAFSSEANQRLIQSLTNQTIRNKGRDILYLPRELVAFDKLYGEDKLSAFSTYFTIEMHIESFTGFGGQRELISKFGYEVRDEITLVVSKSRFNDEVVSKYPTPFILRPREGDLVYFPLDKSLFEITFVDNKETFYALGKLFTYRLFCKRFELAAEQFNTGVERIDNLQKDFGNTTQIGVDVPGQLANVTLILVNNGTVSTSFQAGEGVYQGPTPLNPTWSASVISFNKSTSTLVVNSVIGEIDVSQTIKGVNSGAIWGLTTNYEGVITEPSSTTDRAEQNTDFNDLDSENQITDPNSILNNPFTF